MAKPVLRKPKKKVCQFCKEKVAYVDYKDTTLLRKFISDRGKIRARRVTGNCVQHQRDVAIAVKNAREVALLPYTSHRALRGGHLMKLILTQEVSGLGAPGDVVEVKDGYGRNFLIPRGFAIRWTKGGEKTVDSIKSARATREVRDLDKAKEIKAKLEGATDRRPGPRRRGRPPVRRRHRHRHRGCGRRQRVPRSTSARSWSATRSSRSARTR